MRKGQLCMNTTERSSGPPQFCFSNFPAPTNNGHTDTTRSSAVYTHLQYSIATLKSEKCNERPLEIHAGFKSKPEQTCSNLNQPTTAAAPGAVYGQGNSQLTATRQETHTGGVTDRHTNTDRHTHDLTGCRTLQELPAPCAPLLPDAQIQTL